MQRRDTQILPWYRQFWPWFLIAIPALAVAGGLFTLYLAITHPDYLVVDDRQYDRIRSELRAQDHAEQAAPEADEPR